MMQLLSTHLERPKAVPERTGLLPQAQPSLTVEPSSQVQPTCAVPSVVLIVEDNDDIRRYISRVLSPTYEVLEACDGEEALLRIGERLPDLVVTDVMMPRLDGLELVRILRSQDRTRAIPIVMVSALSPAELKLGRQTSQPDDFLMKPFSSQALTILVRSYMQTKAGR